jgi:Domain of unknown function (DUF3598)
MTFDPLSVSQENPASQWQNLLQNLGVWAGSFTRLSPQADLIEDTPTRVTFASFEQDQAVRQTLEFFSKTGEVTQTKVLEYRSLNRSVLFFENGAFSLGSLQFAPFTEFGAELGFIQNTNGNSPGIPGNCRLRLVQLFDTHGQFTSITLIREHRQHTLHTERPPLTIDQLIGDWQGQAITLYPDWRSPKITTTTLSIGQEGDRLWQRLITPEIDLASTAAIEGSILRFDQGSDPIQVLLLPGGASSNTPMSIPRGKPFFLEAGWLIEPALRQRMIRSYDEKGAWTSLTLVTERKVST